MVAKDNHIPILDKPLEMSADIPCLPNDSIDLLTKWQRGTARDAYAPGNPQGYINYNIKCK